MGNYGFIKRVVFNEKRYILFQKAFFKSSDEQVLVNILKHNGVNFSITTPHGQWIDIIANNEIVGNLDAIRTGYTFNHVKFEMKNYFFHELEESKRRSVVDYSFKEVDEEGQIIDSGEPVEIIDGVYCEVIQYRLISNPSNQNGIISLRGWHSMSCPIG